MKNPYANAEDILPTELVQEIRKYCSGLLWIPHTLRSIREARKNLILNLHNQGTSNKEIAQLAKVTDRRVRQIIGEYGNNTCAKSESSPEPTSEESTDA